jgi:2-polyprenyl-3-methyl-5-hydroxy-6-metoxy-1,4-benzoquinol methylase
MLQTLDEVRAYVHQRSAPLDPQSRYLPELLVYVDAAHDVADLEARLDAGCRGRLFTGDGTWPRMSLEDKLAVNLVTNETELMRFERAEMAHLHERVLPWLRDREGRVASIPCSHGNESVSLAIEMLEAGLTHFQVAGFDIQRACIETAQKGRIPVAGLPRYVTAHVEPIVMEHLSFSVLDVLTQPIPGSYDLVVCRNFLGYFRPEVSAAILDKLLGALARPGCLLVDAFITRKHPQLFSGLRRDGELPFFWV